MLSFGRPNCKFILLCCTVFVASASGQTVSVASYGASTNGTNAAATTAAFRSAFAAAGASGKVLVPPGTYAIDNSGGPLTINNFQGEFKFEGRAVLAFSSGVQGGVLFNSGTGLRVIGFHSTYPNPLSSALPSAPSLAFSRTSNTFVDDAMVENSSGPGIYFNGSQNVKVANVSILNSRAQGIQFVDSANSELVNATIQNAGLEGIVFQATSGTSGVDGGHGTNLTVNGAGSRGIAVYGQSNVTVSGFTVYSSDSSSIFCGTAPTTASPANVLFQGGVIESPRVFGIEVNNAQSCGFANIQVNAPGDRAVSGVAPGGTLDFRNIRVTGGSSGDGFNFSNTGTVRISDSSAERSPGYGFVFDNVQSTVATGLTTYNVSSQNALHRAIWFQNGASAIAYDLTIIDDQSSATGFIIGSSGVTSGSIMNISSKISRSALSVQNRSAGVKIGTIN